VERGPDNLHFSPIPFQREGEPIGLASKDGRRAYHLARRGGKRSLKTEGQIPPILAEKENGYRLVICSDRLEGKGKR